MPPLLPPPPLLPLLPPRRPDDDADDDERPLVIASANRGATFFTSFHVAGADAQISPTSTSTADQMLLSYDTHVLSAERRIVEMRTARMMAAMMVLRTISQPIRSPSPVLLLLLHGPNNIQPPQRQKKQQQPLLPPPHLQPQHARHRVHDQPRIR